MSGAIVAMGGGGFSEEPDNPLLDGFVLEPRPPRAPARVLPGHRQRRRRQLRRALLPRLRRRTTAAPRTSALFNRQVGDLRRFVLEQDVIYVGGGNTASLLAVWRAHRLDVVLREALDAGAVLCGVSAGMNCWFEASTTDSFGSDLEPLNDGLGFVAGSACPHYDAEAQRRPLYHRLVAAGFPSGWAADDGAALHFAAAGDARRGRRVARGRSRLPRRAPPRRRRRRAAAAHALPVVTRQLAVR